MRCFWIHFQIGTSLQPLLSLSASLWSTTRNLFLTIVWNWYSAIGQAVVIVIVCQLHCLAFRWSGLLSLRSCQNGRFLVGYWSNRNSSLRRTVCWPRQLSLAVTSFKWDTGNNSDSSMLTTMQNSNGEAISDCNLPGLVLKSLPEWHGMMHSMSPHQYGYSPYFSYECLSSSRPG